MIDAHVRELREMLGLSQNELARKAEVKVGEVRLIEEGGTCSSTQLARLADAMGVPPMALLGDGVEYELAKSYCSGKLSKSELGAYLHLVWLVSLDGLMNAGGITGKAVRHIVVQGENSEELAARLEDCGVNVLYASLGKGVRGGCVRSGEFACIVLSPGLSESDRIEELRAAGNTIVVDGIHVLSGGVSEGGEHRSTLMTERARRAFEIGVIGSGPYSYLSGRSQDDILDEAYEKRKSGSVDESDTLWL